MGFLDEVKDAIGIDSPEEKTAEAKKKADEAAADAKKEADEAAAEAKKKADEAAAKQAEANKTGGSPPAAPAPKPKTAPKPEAKAKPKAKPAAKKERTYTVKKGDTLSEIGERFGVDYHKIAKANGVKNPDLIYPGQVFTIPD